jgi:ATP synthase subunit 6
MFCIYLMIPDIFSSFDPASFHFLTPTFDLFIIINILLIFAAQYTFWISRCRSLIIVIPILIIITSQLSRTYIDKLKGLNHLVSNLFILIITINLLGLVPYIFSLTRHLIFTISFGFPLWLAIILSTFAKSIVSSIAHFLPDGAPDWLNPFLVIIESTRISVRPMTLSFRLAANIRAGHIVLGLIGIYCSAAWFNSFIALLSLIGASIGYILFEVAICLIQAYIFCLLLSLYSDDHTH